MTIHANTTGICPHCHTMNRFEDAVLGNDRHTVAIDFKHGIDNIVETLHLCRCTNCGDTIMFLDDEMIFPKGSFRPTAPKEVPDEIANDFNEACLVESLSPKAAGALARRCLQNLLHNQGIKKRNLNDEIEETISQLPSHLGNSIDAIRTIGNFAAHPMKYENSGSLVDVEPEEIEWILDVLEQLFDFYYVAPAKTKVKRENLNQKLKNAGKPELK